jgi:ATP synthase mitochondrial F1 complex assembly factor 2
MKRLKRFYDIVSVDALGDSQFRLLLDGRQVRTPLMKPLILPNEGVASAIASEWELQSEFVVPNTMPMNTMFMTWIDVDSPITHRDKWNQITKYFRTDTLRFAEPDVQSALSKAQNRTWEPIESFIESKIGSRISKSSNGFIVPDFADSEIQSVYDNIVRKYPPVKLTILETAAKFTKSGTVGLALVENVISTDQAYNAAFVEETYQRENWGVAEGDHDLNEAEAMLWLSGVSILSSLV